MNAKKLIIFTDGVAVPNPGAAGFGVVIQDERGEPVVSFCDTIGFGTNNQAEYRAVIAALEKAASLGAECVDIRADSELVVRQVNGRYKVKNAALKPLYQRVKLLQGKFKEFTMRHIPREQNREADRLAGQALK